MNKKVAVIGGGASGLAAAALLKDNFDVTIFERNDRVGKKILATGNGRCNLLNTDLSCSHFSSKNKELLSSFISDSAYNDIISFFTKLGLLTKCEAEGRVYPLSNQAATVLDVLRLGATGTAQKCNFTVEKITKKANGFEIISKDGNAEYADIVIIATGGKASPKTGSDGSGYSLAKAFGHSLTTLSPALVPLKSDTSFTLPLKGVRAKSKITLNNTYTEIGEIQFTDYGISGIAAMQLSRHLTGSDFVTIDFADGYSEEYILSLLKRAKLRNPTVSELFVGILNRRIGEELTKKVLNISASTRSDKLSDKDLASLAKAVKAFTLPVVGTLSWDNAQVTSGGIPLCEINAETMESKLCKNLYITGEILDSDGECGGFNLSWAWLCALKSAKALNKGN